MPWVLGVPMNRVYPSGAACAARAVPIVPPAPTTFSTETFAELLADGACDDVCAAPSRERHDDLDASLRKALGKDQRGAQGHESRRQRYVPNPTCREECFHPEHL